MKRVFLLLLATVFTGMIAQAQGFRLGAKAGANFGKIDGKRFNEEFKLGYHLGAFAEIDFGKKFGIQPEVLWQTTRVDTATQIGSAVQFRDKEIKLDYLSIPILLRYNINKLITINAGPHFGILLNKDDNLLQNGQQAFKNGDFGMIAGLQLNLKSLRVYGRYNIGLNNISEIDNTDNWKNQMIQLGLGLKL